MKGGFVSSELQRKSNQENNRIKRERESVGRSTPLRSKPVIAASTKQEMEKNWVQDQTLTPCETKWTNLIGLRGRLWILATQFCPRREREAWRGGAKQRMGRRQNHVAAVSLRPRTRFKTNAILVLLSFLLFSFSSFLVQPEPQLVFECSCVNNEQTKQKDKSVCTCSRQMKSCYSFSFQFHPGAPPGCPPDLQTIRPSGPRNWFPSPLELQKKLNIARKKLVTETPKLQGKKAQMWHKGVDALRWNFFSFHSDQEGVNCKCVIQFTGSRCNVRRQTAGDRTQTSKF